MKLSITRVLSELKLNVSKIETAARKNMVGLYQKKTRYVQNTSETIEEFEKEAVKNFQSLKDLLTRQEKLRTALTQANSINTVLVLGEKMTLSQAISYKEKVLPIKEEIVSVLKDIYIAAVNKSEATKIAIEDQINLMLERNLGKDRKTDKESYNDIAKPFMEANELIITDAADVKKFIDSLEKEVADFKGEIDIALSEANAKYEIEIDD